jgi:hypothetical protein
LRPGPLCSLLVVSRPIEPNAGTLTGDDATLQTMGAEYEGYFMLAGLIMSEIVADTSQEWAGQSTFQKGHTTGTILFEIASMFFGAGGIKAASNVEKLTAIRNRFANAGGFFAKVAGICTTWITRIITTKMCFVAGTLVHTARGLVPIEQIQPGDLVLARDEHDPSRQELKPVVDTVVTHPDVLHHLTWEFRSSWDTLSGDN